MMNSTITIPRKKTISVQGFMLTILAMAAWLLFTGNTASADYQAYKNVFDALSCGYVPAGSAHFEGGFLLFVQLWVWLGVPSYQLFLAVYGVIPILLLTASFRAYTVKPATAFCLYFIFPLLLNIVQIRNFMASAIIIFSLRYLREYNKENLIKFLICLALATSQHISSLMYGWLLLAYVKSTKKIAVVSITATLVIVLVKQFIYPILSWVSGYIPKFAYYIVDYRQDSGGVKQLLAAAMMVALCLYSGHLQIGQQGVIRGDGQQNSASSVYQQMLVKVCVLSLVFAASRMIVGTFLRIYQTCILAQYCVLTNCDWKKHSHRRTERLILLLCSIGYATLLGYLTFNPSSMLFSTVTKPIINENLFLTWFLE